jgi:hypothetical protein
MSLPIYRDVEGELHRHKDVSKHHVFPRCKAKGTPARHFINQAGLVLPLLNEYHNIGEEALHNNVPLAPMPDSHLRHLINQYTSQDFEPNIYDRFIGIAGFITNLAETATNPQIGRQCERIATNLQRQAPFILLGQVELVET